GDAGEILLDTLRERRDLLARWRRRIAGPVPLEELDAEQVFQLAEAAEHRRMVDAEPLGGSCHAFRLGNGLHEANVVPGDLMNGRGGGQGGFGRHPCVRAIFCLRSYRWLCAAGNPKSRSRCIAPESPVTGALP